MFTRIMPHELLHVTVQWTGNEKHDTFDNKIFDIENQSVWL